MAKRGVCVVVRVVTAMLTGSLKLLGIGVMTSGPSIFSFCVVRLCVTLCMFSVLGWPGATPTLTIGLTSLGVPLVS